MKIAFVTDDGKSICKHFGRASKYLVLEVRDGKEESRELRDKLGHNHFHKPGEDHIETHDHNSLENHGKHLQMVAAIEDCAVVIAGGMGQGAVRSIQSMGMDVYTTRLDSIEDALKEFHGGEVKQYFGSRSLKQKSRGVPRLLIRFFILIPLEWGSG